jgi:hypothetical protein
LEILSGKISEFGNNDPADCLLLNKASVKIPKKTAGTGFEKIVKAKQNL